MGRTHSHALRRTGAGLAVAALAALGLAAAAPAAGAAEPTPPTPPTPSTSATAEPTADAAATNLPSFAAAPAADAPKITVSKSTGLDPAGENVTVTGTGFTPGDNIGAYPPLAGVPSGVYVVTGTFATVWQPSKGAPTSARTVIEQRWAAPGKPAALVGNPLYIPLNDDGTFTATLPVAPPKDTPAGTVYGIYVYPASGATNPAQELTVPLTFAAAVTTSATPKTTPTTAPKTTPTTAKATASPVAATTASVQCTAENVPATTGSASLSWAVKSSFLGYVDGALADGSVTAGGGATWNGRTVTWGTGSGSLAATGDAVTFPGTLHLTGHEGVLNVTFSGLTVKRTGAKTGVLQANVASTDMTGKNISASGALANLTFSSVGATGAAGSATLTAAGAKAFAGFYQAGEALDPLTVTVAAGAAAHTVQRCVDAAGNAVSPDGTPLDTLASTGIDTAGMTLLAAALAAAGLALVVATRRRAEHA